MALSLPAGEERNPFDLSTAIELFRSLSSYPAQPLDDPSATEDTPSSLSQPSSSSTSTVKPGPSGTNPFLGALSTAGADKLVSGPLTKTSRTAPVQGPEKETIRPTSKTATKIKKEIRALLSPAPKQGPRLTNRLPSTSSAKTGAPKTISGNTGIHVFVDFSNISIGFSYAIRKALGATKQHNTITPYLSFEILSVILERDRPCEKKILVGSTTDEPSIAEARGLGYEVNILRRVPGQAPQNDEPKPASGKSKGKNSSEQAVDEIIIMKILESLVDHPPSTIVLATGDGNAAEFGDGFIKTIERSLQRGWNVELVAFRHNLNNSWKKLGSPKFHIILLDGYLVDLTRLDQNITLTKEKGKKK